MRSTVQILAIVVLPNFLISCTSLFFVHDPSTGVISAGQLPGFLKSVRCELITFYEVERSRKVAYDKLVQADPQTAFENFAHFEIAPKLYGTFTLELKVTDTAGIGSGTAIDYRRVLDKTATSTTHLGPTVSGQGTYDLIWSFLLKQDATLASIASGAPELAIESSERACYRGPISDLRELELLAEDGIPDRSAFTRIVVNANKPLAAWLRDNGTLISANYLIPAKGYEIAEPAQMYYSFAMQAIAGLEAKYSLVATQWNPLAVQATGSLQQNSNLQIYINGPKAAYANGAKSGSAGFAPKSPDIGTATNPMYVITEDRKPRVGERPAVGETTTEKEKPTNNNRIPRVSTPKHRAPSTRGREQPYLLAPTPLFPPSASP
jgi:hypothetical protein